MIRIRHYLDPPRGGLGKPRALGRAFGWLVAIAVAGSTAGAAGQPLLAVPRQTTGASPDDPYPSAEPTTASPPVQGDGEGGFFGQNENIGPDGGPVGASIGPGPWADPPLHSPLMGRPIWDLFNPPPGRYRGPGQPLIHESWRYRPIYAGWFMGAMEGSPLIDDWVGQKRGFFGGYRLGWDYDHYWAVETRLGFASVKVYDSARAKAAQQEEDAELNLEDDDPFLTRFEHRRDNGMIVWDVDFLYYPWGDSAWRPYVSVGLGLTSVSFIDRLSEPYDHTLFSVPVALGLKYRWKSWLALRTEVTDNIAFSSGGDLRSLQNVSLTAGVEIHFGGARTAYWPYNPGRHYW